MAIRRFDPARAQCDVFTYKEGLLSSVAHDLKLRVTQFSIEADDAALTLSARFDARSLRVVCAMRDGQENPGGLSESDCRTIEQTIVDDILQAKRFSEIHFASREASRAGDGYAIVGTLTLHGRTRELRFSTRKEGDAQVAEVSLHQPDFDIRPYRAMLGTLRIRADVMVRVRIPEGA